MIRKQVISPPSRFQRALPYLLALTALINGLALYEKGRVDGMQEALDTMRASEPVAPLDNVGSTAIGDAYSITGSGTMTTVGRFTDGVSFSAGDGLTHDVLTVDVDTSKLVGDMSNCWTLATLANGDTYSVCDSLLLTTWVQP